MLWVVGCWGLTNAGFLELCTCLLTFESLDFVCWLCFCMFGLNCSIHVIGFP